MLTTRYACTDQALSGRRHVMKWVCVWIFLVHCAQFPRKAACSWFARARDLAAAPSRNAYSALPRGNCPKAAPAPDAVTSTNAGEGSSERNPDISDVYDRLIALRQKFVSVVAKERHPAWVVDLGLAEVASYFSMATRKLQELYERYENDHPTGDPSKYEGVIPDGYSVALMSAATGQVNMYTFRRRYPKWVLEGPRGEVYGFYAWPLEKDGPPHRWTVRRVPGYVQDALAPVAVFGVSSLQQVEVQFGVDVMQDILAHPTWSPHLSFPDGVFLNFIAVWKPVETSLHFVARTMEFHIREATDTEVMDTVEIARLNLTYQVIHLVGRISLRGVLLSRFEVSHFRVRSSGYVSFRPPKVSRIKQHQSPAPGSTAAARREGHPEVWPSFDSFVNGKDVARAILFLWCPTEALDVSMYISSPTIDEIELVLLQCFFMPGEVVDLVRYLFDRNANAGQVLRSDIPNRLQRRLQQLAKRVGSA